MISDLDLLRESWEQLYKEEEDRRLSNEEVLLQVKLSTHQLYSRVRKVVVQQSVNFVYSVYGVN